MEIEFWQTRVEITQIPDIKENSKVKKSWLFDPFLDRRVYGVEMTAHINFSWTFFMKGDTEREALEQGHTFLMSLIELYPGISGNVNAKPITSKELNFKEAFYEIVLPEPHFTKKISLIKKFVNIFYNNKNNFIQMFILWQKDDSIIVEGSEIDRTVILNDYKVKIYVKANLSLTSSEDKQKHKPILTGQLKYLASNVQNHVGKRAYIKKASLDTWRNILEGRIFWKNLLNEITGRFYNVISKEIPREKMPGFISPDSVDFDIIKDFPLPKVYSISKQNVKYLNISKEDKSHIILGENILHGYRTQKFNYVPIDHFAQSVILCGQPGTGKTLLIYCISKEFYHKAPNIGLLFINLGKGNQEMFYKSDRIIKYGSLELKIPYYVKGPYLDKSLQETASYSTASLGLLNPVDRILFIVMKAFIYNNGELPENPLQLMVGLRKWFHTHEYHEKFQTNILRAIDNRVLALFSDPTLNKTMEYSPDSEIPLWFQEWREGKKIYLDLSMCNIWVKRLLSNAIFQMIRTLTPDVEAGKLQNMIVIDEAHQILGRAKNRDSKSDDNVARGQLEEIFEVLLTEFRSKGLSFLISEQSPHLLFDCAVTLPSVKILFRIGRKNSNLFTNDLGEQNFLNRTENRQALVYNGVNGEDFIIRTIEDNVERVANDYKVVRKYCNKCSSVIANNARFCWLCGEPVPVGFDLPSESLASEPSKVKEGE